MSCSLIHSLHQDNSAAADVAAGACRQGHANLASAFKDAARQDAAIASYRRALALRPDFPEAFANLVHSLQVSRFTSLYCSIRRVRDA